MNWKQEKRSKRIKLLRLIHERCRIAERTKRILKNEKCYSIERQPAGCEFRVFWFFLSYIGPVIASATCASKMFFVCELREVFGHYYHSALQRKREIQEVV